MNPTNQNIAHSKQVESRNNLTLEEVDLIGRKCNQLHDEEILITLARIWKMFKSACTHKEKKQNPGCIR
jgi:hypothetical protein